MPRALLHKNNTLIFFYQKGQIISCLKHREQNQRNKLGIQISGTQDRVNSRKITQNMINHTIIIDHNKRQYRAFDLCRIFWFF